MKTKLDIFAPMVFIALVLLILPNNVALSQEKQNQNQNNSETYRLLNLFGEVFERVRAEYVEIPTDEKLIEAAITGILSSLDDSLIFTIKKNEIE